MFFTHLRALFFGSSKEVDELVLVFCKDSKNCSIEDGNDFDAILRNLVIAYVATHCSATENLFGEFTLFGDKRHLTIDVEGKSQVELIERYFLELEKDYKRHKIVENGCFIHKYLTDLCSTGGMVIRVAPFNFKADIDPPEEYFDYAKKIHKARDELIGQPATEQLILDKLSSVPMHKPVGIGNLLFVRVLSQ